MTDGWEVTTVGAVMTLQRGFDVTRSEQRAGPVPVVSSGGVASYNDVAMSPGPGVVIGRKGTLGTVFYLPGPYWPHDTTLWVKDFKGNDPRFTYYFLKQLDVSAFDVGSANPTLNRNHVHPLKIRWPADIRIQRAIADVLETLDDKIAANARLIAGAEDLMRTLVCQGNDVTSLSVIAVSERRALHPSSFTSARVWHYSLPAYDEQQRPIQDLSSDVKSAKFVLDGPCVLISKLNPRFPRVWNVPKGLDGQSVASTEFVVLKPTACSTSMLWAVLSQPSFGAELEGKVGGTSGSHQRVKPADLLATEVTDPRSLNSDVQDTVSALGSLTNQIRQESDRLRIVRDTLLPRLMSGRLRVRYAEKQVEAAV